MQCQGTSRCGRGLRAEYCAAFEGVHPHQCCMYGYRSLVLAAGGQGLAQVQQLVVGQCLGQQMDQGESQDTRCTTAELNGSCHLCFFNVSHSIVQAIPDGASYCSGDHPGRDSVLRVCAPPCGGLRDRRAHPQAGGRLRGLPANHHGCAPAIEACMRTSAACVLSSDACIWRRTSILS